MKPKESLVRLAKTQARLSTHKFRIGAIVYDGNYVLGFGYNKADKTHPRSNTPFFSIHAEFAAILHAVGTNGHESVSNARASIYVHRLKADGSPGLSKPCEWCMKMLKQIPIKNIYWSVD